MSNQETIFIIDDDPDICEAVQWLLESVGLQVKTYCDPLDFLNEYQPIATGCLIIDIRMPRMSGLELQDKLNALGNRLPIIILSGHGDVPMAVRAMKAGAFDFVTKPFNDQALIEMIQKALLLSRDQHSTLKNINIDKLAQRFTTLSPREVEVMELVVQGKLNKIIADKLQISQKTVELHRAHVMEKMKVRSLAELVKLHTLYFSLIKK